MLALDLLLAYFLADLFSGLFHWAEDRYGNPKWPILGPLVVAPNVEHHRRPAAFCRQTYFQRNWTTAVPALTLAALFWWCLPLCFAFILLSQANEVHSWAHRRASPPVRFFQRLGLLQSPTHHRVHHRRPYDRHYCILTNYLNPVLRTALFWEVMEALVWVFTGAKPRPERAIF
jgi:hypothetical protein